MSQKITSFDKHNLPHLRAEFAAAVYDMEQKYGLSIEIGNIKFSSQQFTTRLTVTATGNNANAEEAKHLASIRKAGYKFGIDESHYGKRFDYNGKTWLFRGIRPKAPKWPFLAENVETGQINVLRHTARLNIVN